jgi:hypothetical protein
MQASGVMSREGSMNMTIIENQTRHNPTVDTKQCGNGHNAGSMRPCLNMELKFLDQQKHKLDIDRYSSCDWISEVREMRGLRNVRIKSSTFMIITGREKEDSPEIDGVLYRVQFPTRTNREN